MGNKRLPLQVKGDVQRKTVPLAGGEGVGAGQENGQMRIPGEARDGAWTQVVEPWPAASTSLPSGGRNFFWIDRVRRGRPCYGRASSEAC